MPLIRTKREDPADDLWRFGEEALAERVTDAGDVSEQPLVRIGAVAWKYASSDEYATPSGRGMMISKALAHAAVEVLEGRERPLARAIALPLTVLSHWDHLVFGTIQSCRGTSSPLCRNDGRGRARRAFKRPYLLPSLASDDPTRTRTTRADRSSSHFRPARSGSPGGGHPVAASWQTG